MTTTSFCTSEAAIVKAGANINSDLSAGNTVKVGSEDAVDLWISEAACVINTICREDFSTTYGNLSVNKRDILADAASSHAAVKCIIYDMSGYGSRTEAESMINVLLENFQRNIGILKKQESQDFINGT